MKGIDLVAQEREEQINKHGFTLEDDSFHRNNELIKAALFCLNDEVFEFPFHWNVSYRNRILRKDKIGRLKTAAAYIVAQLDQELLKSGNYK